MKYRLGIIFISFFILFVQFGSAATLEETFEKKVEFAPGGFISLENVNGTVEVNGWDQNTVSIEAVKKVKASDEKDAKRFMKEVEIEISRNKNELFVKTKLPENMRSGLLDWIFGDGTSASVNYVIHVPQRSDLDLNLTNGAVSVTDVAGRLKLKSTNGKIEATRISGEMDAHTTNGSIAAEFTQLSKDGRSDFSTTNGSIKIQLPSEAAAEVKGKTVNGSINTDFPLEVSGKYNSKKLSGTINGGGSTMDISTTNGSIELLKK